MGPIFQPASAESKKNFFIDFFLFAKKLVLEKLPLCTEYMLPPELTLKYTVSFFISLFFCSLRLNFLPKCARNINNDVIKVIMKFSVILVAGGRFFRSHLPANGWILGFSAVITVKLLSKIESVISMIDRWILISLFSFLLPFGAFNWDGWVFEKLFFKFAYLDRWNELT